MAFSRTKIKHTYYVNYSSKDGRNFGIMTVSYCKNDEHAIAKAKQELLKMNSKAVDYNFMIA